MEEKASKIGCLKAQLFKERLAVDKATRELRRASDALARQSPNDDSMGKRHAKILRKTPSEIVLEASAELEEAQSQKRRVEMDLARAKRSYGKLKRRYVIAVLSSDEESDSSD